MNKRRKRIEQGSHRIDKYLDIVRHIKYQIRLEQFFKAKVSRVQAYFIKRNRKFVLSSDQSPTSSASDNNMPAAKLDSLIE